MRENKKNKEKKKSCKKPVKIKQISKKKTYRDQGM